MWLCQALLRYLSGRGVAHAMGSRGACSYGAARVVGKAAALRVAVDASGARLWPWRLLALDLVSRRGVAPRLLAAVDALHTALHLARVCRLD